jgi:hypothetical protein
VTRTGKDRIHTEFQRRNLLERFTWKNKMKIRDSIKLDLVKTGVDQNVSGSWSILQALDKLFQFHRKE